MSLPQIPEFILKILDANGGSYSGTMRLANEIPASRLGVLYGLRRCQHDHLVKSIHSHGGRGHKSVHRLTRAGRWILTQKGKEHVQSK
jgi:hypothetical protein